MNAGAGGNYVRAAAVPEESLAEALALAWAKGPRCVVSAALEELGVPAIQQQQPEQHWVHSDSPAPDRRVVITMSETMPSGIFINMSDIGASIAFAYGDSGTATAVWLARTPARQLGVHASLCVR